MFVDKITRVKILLVTLLVVLALVPVYFLSSSFLKPAQALEPVEELQKQIDDLERLKKMSVDATAPLEKELDNLESRIKSARNGITAAKESAKELAQEIESQEEELAIQYVILSSRIAAQYQRARSSSPLLMFFTKGAAADLTRDLAYRNSIEQRDNKLIAGLNEKIISLESNKKKLEEDQVRLASLEKQLDVQADFFRGEIAGAQAYQSELSGKIAALSAKQQEILAKKSGTFQTSVGDVPQADDPASRPDYNPGFSPAFAAFSFGAPHYKGMSQYGAYGRAKSGQSVEEILRAYYGGGIEIKKDYSTNININVRGHGSVDIETYVKRIYEMPASWGDKGGMEALKAQAVAARSYALAYTNNGQGSICDDEGCQVYKPANKGGKWDEAVNATKGWVLMANGKPFSSWYASTSGGYQESYSYNGYSTPGFWDTQSGRSGWTSQAYEKIAESPWFYKGWYRTRSKDSCGRSHPWLTGEEMADILNAWVVLVKHGQGDDRVVPQGACWGGNPYSLSELRDKAASLGSGYSKVTSVSVTYGTNGVTATVEFETNKGRVNIAGAEFKKAFNLRAPGRVAVKSGLFNIEQK